MRQLDINKLEIIAKEFSNNENITEVYIVGKKSDGKYDDPLACLVELKGNMVYNPEPFHQFWKFCQPVDLNISEKEKTRIKQKFLEYSIKAQRMLISLYDPDILEQIEPININDVHQYVKSRLLLPLSEQEFHHIETGFRLQWNYSNGKKAGDCDFKQAVGQYLLSIDYPIAQKKMEKVVDQIFEYLEWIGQRG